MGNLSEVMVMQEQHHVTSTSMVAGLVLRQLLPTVAVYRDQVESIRRYFRSHVSKKATSNFRNRRSRHLTRSKLSDRNVSKVDSSLRNTEK